MARRQGDGVASRFARVHGSPGQHARLTGLFASVWPFLLAALCAGYLLRAALPVPPVSRSAAGGFLLLLGAGIILTATWAHRRLGSYFKGAQGEEVVARELALLPAGYEVFHGILLPVAGSESREGDLDHVVVGPTGVFLVETKNWKGPVTVEQGRVLYDGKEPDRPPLEQVRRAATGLRKFLERRLSESIEVAPVVCFACDTMEGRTQGVGGAIVCNRRYLCAVIEDSMERPMDPALGQRIGDCLREFCG